LITGTRIIGAGDSISNRPFSHISDLHDLDLGVWTAYRRVQIRKKFLWTNICTDGWMDTETSFSRSTRRSQRNYN